jgi:hypothetical protein
MAASASRGVGRPIAPFNETQWGGKEALAHYEHTPSHASVKEEVL